MCRGGGFVGRAFRSLLEGFGLGRRRVVREGEGKRQFQGLPRMGESCGDLLGHFSSM